MATDKRRAGKKTHAARSLEVEPRGLESKELRLPKIIWSCPNCGTVLPVWKMKCSNCHKAALSWLHVAMGVVVALPAVFLLLKLI